MNLRTQSSHASGPGQRCSDERREWGVTGLFFGALTVLCGLTFAPALRTPFFIDDFGYLNVTLADEWWTSGLLRDLSAQVLRPVTVIAIGLQQELFGFDPLPFHVLALGLLAAAGVLLYLVARRLGVGVFGSRTAGAVLMLHTTNGWTLAWTASTSSLYAVVFGLGAVLVTSGSSISRRQMTGAVALLVLGLLSREISIVVPLLVVCVRFALADGEWRARTRRSLREARPLLVLLCLFIAARALASVLAQSRPQDDRLIPILNLASFTDTLPMVPDHVRAILMLATSPFRSTIGDTGFTFPISVVVVGVVVWALIIALVVHETRRDRTIPLLGLAWFVIAVLPPIFLQPEIIYGNYADMAIPGLALAIGAGIGTMVSSWSAPARGVLAAAGIALLSFVAHHGGNALFSPPPPPVARAMELEAWARQHYPSPLPRSTIVVDIAIPEDQLWTSNGDMFRVMYQDPTLKVVFGSARGDTAG